jgi:LemA protein
MIESATSRVERADPRRRGAVGKGLLVLGVLLLLVLGIGGCGVGRYNSLVGEREATRAKWQEIDNQYKRRNDLIDNLVATVRGAADFEQSTLREVTEARASVGRASLPSDLPTDPAQVQRYIEAQNQLGGALSRLLVVTENYPQLRASQNFLSLQDQIEGTENRIAVARRDYIDAAQRYNTSLGTFPNNLIAGFFDFDRAATIEATAQERAVPKVDFGGFGNRDEQPK